MLDAHEDRRIYTTYDVLQFRYLHSYRQPRRVGSREEATDNYPQSTERMSRFLVCFVVVYVSVVIETEQNMHDASCIPFVVIVEEYLHNKNNVQNKPELEPKPEKPTTMHDYY